VSEKSGQLTFGFGQEYSAHNIPPVCVAGSPGEPPAASLKPVDEARADRAADRDQTERAGLHRSQHRSAAEELVEELHVIHPQPGLPDKAVGEVEKILAVAEDHPATIALIRANHAMWRAHWEILRPGAFIPQLWRWFRDGEWKRTVGKPVRHETFYEKAERACQEWQAEEPERQARKAAEAAEAEEWNRQQADELAEQQRAQRQRDREYAAQPWPREAWMDEWDKLHAKTKIA
jgi:hypothetical protein